MTNLSQRDEFVSSGSTKKWSVRQASGDRLGQRAVKSLYWRAHVGS